MVGSEDSYHFGNIEKILPVMVEVSLLAIDKPLIAISLVSRGIPDIAVGHSFL